MQAPVMSKISAARAEKGWCEGEVLVLLGGLYQRRGMGRGGGWDVRLSGHGLWLVRLLGWRGGGVWC